MGIVRLAKSLRLIDSIQEYDNREEDIQNKISGNRVYMDFVSIVYRIQENVLMELNFVLYALMLFGADKEEYHILSDKFRSLFKKYMFADSKYLLNNIDFDMKEINPKKVDDKIFLSNMKVHSKKILDLFKKFIRQKENIYEFVYLDVIFFITDMLTNKVKDVEYLLIAFDGIPSFAKIQEQRHRRYTRKIHSELIDLIKKDHRYRTEHELRHQYDMDHFTLDIRSAIEYVYKQYNSNRLQEDIIKGIHKLLPNNKKVEVEVINEAYGEGEKVLMDKLILDYPSFKNKSYIFYSPDGDSVILCLYILCFLKDKYKFDNEFNVVKTYYLNPSKEHNEQCQYIDIPLLFRNIIKTIEKISKVEIKSKYQNNIIYDYIMLMTLFGNDFLHQIPTLDISVTTMDILYIYAQFISGDIESKVIMNMSKEDKIKPNLDNFIGFFKELASFEEYLMLESGLGEFERKGKIINLFGHFFTRRYYLDYIEKVTLLEKDFQGITENSEGMRVLENIINELNQIKTLDNKSYGKIYLKEEVKFNKSKYVSQIIEINKSTPEEQKRLLTMVKPKYIYYPKTRRNKNEFHLWEIINSFEEKLIDNGEEIDLKGFNFESDDNDHLRQVKNILFEYYSIRSVIPHPMMPTTKKDIQMFLLEWKAGPWMKKLESSQYDFGYEIYSYKDNKSIKTENIEQAMNRYENDLLDNEDMNSIISSYLDGLFWVLDYYFNNTNININKKNISTWSYVHERSPFLGHLNNYLQDRSNIDRIKKSINTYSNTLVNVNDYLNEQEHKLYLYPIDDKLFKKIQNIDQKNKTNYSSAFIISERLTKKIYNSKKGEPNIIDCRLAPYFSKCIIKLNHQNVKFRNLSYDEYTNLLDMMEKES